MLKSYFEQSPLIDPKDNQYLYKGLEQKSKIGFYFHIPFCIHLCPYCDFVKTAKFKMKDVDLFFEKIYQDLDSFLSFIPMNFKEFYSNVTIYLGGGTPGLFKASYYEPIIKKLERSFEIEELTIEANPLKDLSKVIEDYSKLGVTRMTLGAQSIDESVLTFLGRKHHPDMVLRNIEEIKKAGINEVQVDFITGIKKGIRQGHLRDEFECALNQGATGISSYGLTIEEKTQFFGKDVNSDEEAYDDYFTLLDVARENHLKQLETSNFGKFEGRHNNLYWHGFPYIAFGTGAHGLLPPTMDSPYGRRYQIGLEEELLKRNLGDFKLSYQNSEVLGNLFSTQLEEKRSFHHFREEMIFTLLRTPRGIPLHLVNLFWENQDSLKNLMGSDPILSLALEKSILMVSNNGIMINEKEKIRGDYWTNRLLML